MQIGPILIVEDDDDIRESLMEVLEERGYKVVGARDGYDALQYLRTCTTVPRLILLDLMMPRLDGAAFRVELAKEPLWSSIPIIVISAEAQAREKATAIGAIALVRKPIALPEFFATVKAALEGKP